MILRNLLLAALLLGAASAGISTASEGFLIPGADISKLQLREGAWCRYIVTDEALGQTDSSEVYIGIPSRETTSQGEAYWVEILTRPWGGGPAETDMLRMLVVESITGFAEGDSLGDYVLKLYNRKGVHPPQEEDPKQYDDFSLVTPTTDSSWESAPGVRASTSAGDFTCTRKHKLVTSDREVVTGNVTLKKKVRDDFSVWFCEDIPVFRLARCEIERVRQTTMEPPIAGVPMQGPKDSKTTAELIAYGYDAAPMMSAGAGEP